MHSPNADLRWGKREDKLLIEAEDDKDDKKQFWIMVGILCLVFAFSPAFVSEQRSILLFLGAIWYTLYKILDRLRLHQHRTRKILDLVEAITNVAEQHK
jgi:hypothetical protein